MTEEMNEEMRAEAIRQGISLSAIAQIAWMRAKERIKGARHEEFIP